MTDAELKSFIRKEIWKALMPEKQMRSRSLPHADLARAYASGTRRRKSPMCSHCLDGKHELCQSFGCPCVCNDDAWDESQIDISIASVPAPGAAVTATA